MAIQSTPTAAPRFLPRRGCNRPAPAHQRGVALVVSLILLIVIALVGLAAVRGTIMQQKMTANFYDRQIAFQANEGALRAAEEVIRASTNPKDFRNCTSDGPNECYANPFSSGSGLPGDAIVTVSTADFDAGKISASQPQYVIEYMGRFSVPDSTVKNVSTCSGYLPCPSSNNAGFYRITARSGRITARSGPDSGKGRASVTLQSTFRK